MFIPGPNHLHGTPPTVRPRLFGSRSGSRGIACRRASVGHATASAGELQETSYYLIRFAPMHAPVEHPSPDVSAMSHDQPQRHTRSDSTPCDKMPKDHPPFHLQSTRTRDPRGRDAPTCMHATTVLCAPPRQIRDRRVRGRCTCPGGRRAATNVRPRRGSPRNLMRGGRLPVQRPPAHPPQPASWYPPPWP